MIQLTSPKVVKELLDKYQLFPNKKLGQNFLFDESALFRIADSVSPDRQNILEIGPGLGALTQQLALRANKVLSVEIDKGFLQVLDQSLADFNNVEIIHGDFLKMDLNQLHEKLGSSNFSVCANLPYYITTPILMRLLESGLPWQHLCFLMQSEVADRMAATPGSKSYGSLSIAVQYYANTEILFKVSPSCFIPQPKVDSLVLRLSPKETPLSKDEEIMLFRITRAAFAMRRKTLANNLSQHFPNLDKESVQSALESLGISPQARAESLSLQNFIDINKLLSSFLQA